jgi:hypothetical protein
MHDSEENKKYQCIPAFPCTKNIRGYLINNKLLFRFNKMHAFVESTSQPITARHFTGSDACHIIINNYSPKAK